MLRKPKLYEHDALAHSEALPSHERERINHIAKAKARQRGAEVVFDPKGHKDFVTGFRKRKQQRRKDAQRQLETKAKQERSKQRAERRAKLKQDLGLPDDYGVSSGSDDEGRPREGEVVDPSQDARAGVTVYRQGGVTTTVSVLDLNADSDEPAGDDGGSGSDDLESDGPEDGGSGEGEGGDQHHEQQQRQQQRDGRRGGKRGKRRSQQGSHGKRRPHPGASGGVAKGGSGGRGRGGGKGGKRGRGGKR